jgi:hypothetical protein
MATRGSAKLAKHPIAQEILQVLDDVLPAVQDNEQTSVHLLRELDQCLTELESAIKEALAPGLLEQKAKEMAKKEVAKEELLFTSRRMRRMQKLYELLVKYEAQQSQRLIGKLYKHLEVAGLQSHGPIRPALHLGWTVDDPDLTRNEEMFELRPSKVKGLIGVWSKVTIPANTMLQYSGLIVDKATVKAIYTKFKSTTTFEFPESSELKGHFLIGNPMRIGLQINHTEQVNANCDIVHRRQDVQMDRPQSSSVVHFLIPAELKADTELLTYYGGDFFDKEKPSCDRCLLRTNLGQNPRVCSEADCDHSRHDVCFLPGESKDREEWKCDDHQDRLEFHIKESQKKLQAQAKAAAHPYPTRSKRRPAVAAGATPGDAQDE